MGEYWDLFLNWLNLNNQPAIAPRIAPRAEDRYANSVRLYEDDPYFAHAIKYNNSVARGVVLNVPYSILPAIITRSINGNDTIYRETPEQKRFRLRGFPKTRTASNRDKNRKEYKTLERRFNTAWNLAK